jgi:hypothetical protein
MLNDFLVLECDYSSAIVRLPQMEGDRMDSNLAQVNEEIKNKSEIVEFITLS